MVFSRRSFVSCFLVGLLPLGCGTPSANETSSPPSTPNEKVSDGGKGKPNDSATKNVPSAGSPPNATGSITKDGWGTSVTGGYPGAVIDPASCFQISVQDRDWRWGLEGYWTGDGLSFWMDKSVFPKYEQPSFLIVKFLSGDRNWGSGPQAISTPLTLEFGPTQGASGLVTTCELCPILHTNVWGDNPTSVWYPVQGALRFEQANATTREYVGTVENVVFRRVGIFGMKDYRDWVVSEDCAYLSSTHFDTRHVDGRPCDTSDTCPNSRYHVCDPDTKTCVASQCDSGQRWNGATGKMEETGKGNCLNGKRCQLVLDTDDWYYGAHVEHAYTTGVCISP